MQKMQDLVKGIPEALRDHCRVQSTLSFLKFSHAENNSDERITASGYCKVLLSKRRNLGL